ncbi:MAG: signal peptidase II [Candidatus Berkelbacteria bacterium]|nr:signal peptidase II [Candidatus Berkelbacteria bacterium]
MVKKKSKFFLLVVLFVLVDQISKYFVISKFFYLSSINVNASFSLPLKNIAMIYISVVLLIFFVFVYAFYIKRYFKAEFETTMILSGAFSNLLDRFARHGVIDFINLKIWPSFNLADILITTGSILLIYKILFALKQKEN